jgi:hypothetical protein
MLFYRLSKFSNQDSRGKCKYQQTERFPGGLRRILLWKTEVILLLGVSTIIAVVAVTMVEHTAHSLVIYVSLASKPNVYGSLWCESGRRQAVA